MKTIYIYSMLCMSIILGATGCKKIIEVDSPKNQLTTDKVFSDSTTADAAIVSIYSAINVDADPQYSINLSLYTDELSYNGPTQEFSDFYSSRVPSANSTNFNIWKTYYFMIYQCNDAIAQLSNNKFPDSYTKSRISELKFLRAYAYYQLLNFFGRIPLILTTDVNMNAKASQSEASIVWQQIISDLKEAVAGLPENYSGTDRVRANKWAAAALLAKAYLETGDFSSALSTSNAIIASGMYSPLPALSGTFLSGSQETILAIATLNGFTFTAQSLIADGAPPQFPLTATLLNSFETNDQRKTNWVAKYNDGTQDYFYPYKYHNNTNNSSTPENLVVLRAAEQYLVRAEAHIQLDQVQAGIADINIVRTRAGLLSLALTISKDLAIIALFNERRHELFSENASRLMDLKRSGKIDQVLGVEKSGWSATDSFLPIPRNEITYNRNLQQNPGY